MKKHLASYLLLASATLATFAGPYAAETPRTHWEWAGWGGGGYFWSVAADPTNPDIFYLGGDVLGVYKSTDGGRSWKIVNDGIQNYGVYTLATAPSDSKVVYAMTDDGVARSRDGAATWTPLKESLNTSLKISTKRGGSNHAIAVDPRNADVLYAGSGRGELFKSEDGGDSWTRLDFFSALPKDGGDQGPAAPSGSSFLWFGVNFPNGDWSAHARLERFLSQGGLDWSAYKTLTAKVFLPAGNAKMSASLVIQSGDGWTWVESPFQNLTPGAWTDVSLDLSKVTDPASCRLVHLAIRRQQNDAFKGEIGVDAVALLPKDGGKPTVIGDWETKDLDGWRKSNAKDARFSGATRSSKSAAEPENGPVATVFIPPTAPATVFVAHSKQGLFRSTDGGATWKHYGNLPKNAAVVAGGWTKSPKLLYAGFGKNGLFRSTDSGDTWTKVETLGANYSVRDICIDPRDANVVHVLATDGWRGDYLVSRDGGATWKANRDFKRDMVGNPTNPAEGAKGGLSAAPNFALSPANPDRLVISANWNNLVSHDGGNTWIEASKGADITCFHDLRFCGKYVYGAAMDEGVFRSDDNGSTWKVLAPKRYTEGLSGHQWRVLPQQLADGSIRILSTVSAWRAAKEYPNQVLVFKNNGEPYGDKGENFVRATGLPDYIPHANTMWGEGYARAIAADPKNPDIVYLGLDGDPEGGKSGGGVFKSTDGGLTWKQLANQPGSRRMFYGIAVDPTDSNRIFWAACGATSGVYMSPDGGETWTKTSCPTEWFFNLDIMPDGTVLAGGNNLWISRDHGTTWKQSTKFQGLCACGITFDPENTKRIWVAGTNWSGSSNGGIFESTDGGETWTEITGDIGYRRPLIVRYNPATQELWAAGVGAFRTKR